MTSARFPRMLSPRQARLAFVPLTVTLMSAVMSFVLTGLNLGWGADFLAKWLNAWALAFAVGLPVAWIVVPSIRRLLDRLVRESGCEPFAERLGGKPS